MRYEIISRLPMYKQLSALDAPVSYYEYDGDIIQPNECYTMNWVGGYNCEPWEDQ